jgi:hypothetical protein
MGTDIHCALEIRKGGKWIAQMQRNEYFGKWKDEPEMTAKFDVGGRDYDLFAILGNVRNGHGFAGCDTGDGFNFITDLRGIPADASSQAIDALSHEHSASWVTVAELLAFDWTQTTVHRGWVTAVEFEKWERMKEWKPAPDSWCGAVSGGKVQHVSEYDMRKKVTKIMRGGDHKTSLERLEQELESVYCQISWVEQYSESVGHFWKVIMPRLMKLANEHGAENVRLIFDFDS